MDWRDKVVVITGSGAGIGQAIKQEFEAEGAIVCGIDRTPGEYFQGDLSDQTVLEAFAGQVLAEHGSIDYLIHNAPPIFKGIGEASYQDMELALQVGVIAPFYLSKLLSKAMRPGGAIVLISSTRESQSQPQSETYAAAKGGLSALTHALAISLAGRVRVNAIAPGWIDTTDAVFTGSDASQHPVGRVGQPKDIAHMVLYLCSDQASFITGQTIYIDGGMSRQMVYHGDHGWQLEG